MKRKFKVGDIIREEDKTYTIVEVDDKCNAYKCRSCTDYGEIDDEWISFPYVQKYCELVLKNQEIPTNKIIEKREEVINCNGILPKSNIDMKDNNVEQFKQIAQEISALYEKKNTAYGNSFGDTYKKLGIISAVTRISDKYNRLCNLATNPNVDDLGESLEDTLKDLAAYSIMTLIELKNKQY